jgi:uncharacterized protein YxeA
MKTLIILIGFVLLMIVSYFIAKNDTHDFANPKV